MSTSEAAVSPQRKEWLKKRRFNHISIVIARIFILAGILIAWELAARFGVIDEFIMSSPSRFFGTIINMWSKGELLYHVGITTAEAVCGFVFGCLFGTVIAIGLWSSSFVCAVIEPYLVVLNALPKIALGPVFIVWIGRARSP